MKSRHIDMILAGAAPDEIGPSTPDDLPGLVPPTDDEPPPHSDADLEHLNGEVIADTPPEPSALSFADPATWEGREIPQREWLVHDWIPGAAVTLLSGDGAIGKTTLALQLAVAVVRGADWIGGVVDRPGPVIFFSAEEEEAEVWRRLNAICASRQLTLGDLSGLEVLCMPDGDCAMAAPDRAGLMQATELWNGLEAAIDNLRPSLVVLEAAADLFGGNEINRRQVSQFIRILRVPALRTRASVMLLAHPSAAGRNTGSGESGSTQWHNSVRSRLYLTSTKGDGGDEDAPDTDLRELRFMKSNYGPKGRPLLLRWERGVYVPVGGVSPIERAAADAGVDDVFLRCLDVRTAQGIEVGPNPGPNYAPAVFARMPEAGECRKKALAASMDRLLSQGRVKVERVGYASKPKSIIRRTEDAA